MSNCEYCDKPVGFPLPVHAECARIWLRGFHAGSGAKLETPMKFMGAEVVVAEGVPYGLPGVFINKRTLQERYAIVDETRPITVEKTEIAGDMISITVSQPAPRIIDLRTGTVLLKVPMAEWQPPRGEV